MGSLVKRMWGAAKEAVTNPGGVLGLPQAFKHIYGKDPTATLGVVFAALGPVVLATAVHGFLDKLGIVQGQTLGENTPGPVSPKHKQRRVLTLDR